MMVDCQCDKKIEIKYRVFFGKCDSLSLSGLIELPRIHFIFPPLRCLKRAVDGSYCSQ